MKNKIKRFIRNLKRRWFQEEYPLRRLVASFLRGVLENEFDSKNYSVDSLQITKITAKESKNKLDVYIELGRPGLLIGKGGSTFDMVKSRLQAYFQKDVEIHIKESIIW